MGEELYRKHRPTDLADIVGQDEAVRVLQTFISKGNIPHAMLFTGPSGCGKTTLARILKRELDCGDTDFVELDCADFRGIDMVRDIRARVGYRPLSGACRIWLIDEAQKMTSDAQNAFLKLLEEPPDHVYFMLATTEPNKLIRPIITRCTEVKVKGIPPKLLRQLVASVIEKEIDESSYPPGEVIDKIVELAEGSARKALVLLESVINIPKVDDQLEALEKGDFKAQSIEIARALLNPRTKWPDMCRLLKGVEEEPETIRRMVLGYAGNVMLGGKNAARAFLIIQAFRDHYFDCGKAGLIASCYEVVNGG